MGYTGHSNKIKYDKKGNFLDPEDSLIDGLTSMFKGKEPKFSNGRWKTYHLNGEIEELGNYKNGKMEGEWEFYYDNKQLEVKGLYENNKMEGEWIYYEKNGKLSERRIYSRGDRVGEWIHYENEKIWEIKNYKNDQLNGKNTRYYENGNIQEEIIWKNDEVVSSIEYYENKKRVMTSLAVYFERFRVIFCRYFYACN